MGLLHAMVWTAPPREPKRASPSGPSCSGPPHFRPLFPCVGPAGQSEGHVSPSLPHSRVGEHQGSRKATARQPSQKRSLHTCAAIWIANHQEPHRRSTFARIRHIYHIANTRICDQCAQRNMRSHQFPAFFMCNVQCTVHCPALLRTCREYMVRVWLYDCNCDATLRPDSCLLTRDSSFELQASSFEIRDSNE